MKIKKAKKVFTVATILGYVPEVMSLNTKNAQTMKVLIVVDCKTYKKTIRIVKKVFPRDEEVRWVRIKGWHIPYTWSTKDGCWYRLVIHGKKIIEHVLSQLHSRNGLQFFCSQNLPFIV